MDGHKSGSVVRILFNFSQSKRSRGTLTLHQWFYQKNKILIQRKWAILGPNMMHSHKFGSTLKMFLKFCTMKGVKRYMKISVMVFQKKLFGVNSLFCAQERPVFITLDLVQGLFLIFNNERCQ